MSAHDGIGTTRPDPTTPGATFTLLPARAATGEQPCPNCGHRVPVLWHWSHPLNVRGHERGGAPAQGRTTAPARGGLMSRGLALALVCSLVGALVLAAGVVSRRAPAHSCSAPCTVKLGDRHEDEYRADFTREHGRATLRVTTGDPESLRAATLAEVARILGQRLGERKGLGGQGHREQPTRRREGASVRVPRLPGATAAHGPSSPTAGHRGPLRARARAGDAIEATLGRTGTSRGRTLPLGPSPDACDRYRPRASGPRARRLGRKVAGIGGRVPDPMTKGHDQ